MATNELKNIKMIHRIRELCHFMIGAISMFFLIVVWASHEYNGFMWIQIAAIITPFIALIILNMIFYVNDNTYRKVKQL